MPPQPNNGNRVAVDTMLHPQITLPIAPDNAVLRGTSIAIDAGRIRAVGPREKLLQEFHPTAQIELPNHVVLPGLVNAHGHLAMSLFRGLGEGQTLAAWLRKTIWPLESQWVDPDFVSDGVDLAIAEMVSTGTTCASDMYYFPEVAAERAIDSGFRLQVAFPVIDVPNAWSQNVDECIHKGLALHDQYRADSLVAVAFGPHAAYTLDDQILSRVLMLADELEAGIQIHLHETADEVARAVAAKGTTWIRHLDTLGLLIPRLQAVHMTQVDDAELELLRDRGCHVVHCPQSNMKLASGVCRLTDMMSAGVHVAIGTDGAASNNALDLFRELHTAALLAKSESCDPTTAGGADMLYIATMGGAAALGLDAEIGSIEAGKAADLIAIDLNNPALLPLHDVHAQLLHATASRHVTHTWIEGRTVYENHTWPTLDMPRLTARAAAWGRRMTVDAR